MKYRRVVLASLLLPLALPASGQTTAGLVAITPCRMVDTRVDTSGGPITGTVRNLRLTGAAYSGIPAGNNPCSAALGAPATATSIQVNFTMNNVTSAADLRVAPWGTAPTTSIMNSQSGFNLAQEATETAASNGAGGKGISVKSGGAAFDLAIDVLGYYTTDLATASPVVAGNNLSASGAVAGVSGSTISTAANAAGVLGTSSAASGPASGVRGVAGSSGGFGVSGSNASGVAVDGSSTSGTGVRGEATGASGVDYGVFGSSASAAGFGVYGTNSAANGFGLFTPDRVHVGKFLEIATNAGSSGIVNIGDLYRDNAVIAWGKILAAGTLTDDFGVSSISHPSTGVYHLVLTSAASSTSTLVPVASAVVAVQPVTAAAARLVTVHQVSTSAFEIFVTDGTFAAANNDLVFVVTGR